MDEEEKYVIFLCGEKSIYINGKEKQIFHGGGGLGDRYTGIMSAMILAKVLKRKFLLRWNDNIKLGKYLKYP